MSWATTTIEEFRMKSLVSKGISSQQPKVRTHQAVNEGWQMKKTRILCVFANHKWIQVLMCVQYVQSPLWKLSSMPLLGSLLTPCTAAARNCCCSLDGQRHQKKPSGYFVDIIKGSLEVLTSDYTESCRELLQHRCLTAKTFWRVGIARNAVFFHSFVASKARKGRSEKRKLRRIGCPRCRQNLHHACARERFGSQNR